MHDRIANTLIVSGALSVSTGASLLHPAAGFVVWGAFCILGGYLLALNNVRR